MCIGFDLSRFFAEVRKPDRNDKKGRGDIDNISPPLYLWYILIDIIYSAFTIMGEASGTNDLSEIVERVCACMAAVLKRSWSFCMNC